MNMKDGIMSKFSKFLIVFCLIIFLLSKNLLAILFSDNGFVSEPVVMLFLGMGLIKLAAVISLKKQEKTELFKSYHSLSLDT